MDEVSEVLTVTGFGSTRDSAIENADRKAAQYFGETAYRRASVGQARPETEFVNGTVVVWQIEVDYRPGVAP